jgi:hypothetical protein
VPAFTAEPPWSEAAFLLPQIPLAERPDATARTAAEAAQDATAGTTRIPLAEP